MCSGERDLQRVEHGYGIVRNTSAYLFLFCIPSGGETGTIVVAVAIVRGRESTEPLTSTFSANMAACLRKELVTMSAHILFWKS